MKIGEEHKEEKNQKPRNKWKDFGEFIEEYWWGLVIVTVMMTWIIGDIGDAIKPNVRIIQEKAVVIKVLNTHNDYKVKYLSDGAVSVVDLGNAAYVMGDTVLTKR